MAEKFTSLQVKKYNVGMWLSITITIITDLTSSLRYSSFATTTIILPFCSVSFQISRTPLGAYLPSSNANLESITGWKQRLSLQQVLACCDTIPPSAVIWAPEVVDGRSIVLR